MSLHRRLLPTLTALVLTTGATSASGAQAPAAADSVHTARGMQDSVTVLPTVRVHGDAVKHGTRDAATSVRLQRAQIARFQQNTIGDALATTPGIEISRPGPWATRVSLRGMSDERVLVLVDGVRLSSGLGHGAQTSLVSIDRLEEVDVEPGAGSARYGSDALGGVVELTTHRPLIKAQPTNVLTLGGRFAEPGGGGAQFARARIMGPKMGGELSVSLGRMREFAGPDSTLAHSGYREQEVSGRLVGQLGGANLDYEHTQHATYDAGLPAFLTPAGGRASYPLSARAVDRWELRLGGEAAPNTFRLLGSQQRFRDDFNEVTVESLFVRRVFRASRTTDGTTRNTVWSRSVRPELQLGRVRLHGEWRRDQLSGPADATVTTRNSANDITDVVALAGADLPNARQEFRAAGASGGLDLPWSLRIEGGTRYDWSHVESDSAAAFASPELDVTQQRGSGELGLRHVLGPLTTYANAGTAFRVPTMIERYFDGYFHGGLRLYGDPTLQPERTNSFELGARLGETAGGALRSARVSFYRSRIRDFIDIAPLGQVFGVMRFQFANVRRAQQQGFEAELESALRGVGMGVNGQFPRARDLDTGKPLRRFGASRVTTEFRVPLPARIPSGMFVAQVRWTDGVRSDDVRFERRAHWMGGVELSSVVHGSRLALAVRNVTNTRYQDPLSFYPGEGRTWSLSVRRDLSLPFFPSRRVS